MESERVRHGGLTVKRIPRQPLPPCNNGEGTKGLPVNSPVTRCVLMALFGLAALGRAAPVEDYGTEALLVDVGLVGGGTALWAASELLDDEILSDTKQTAFLMVTGGALFGGALSHLLHDNPGAVKSSIWLRVKYTGFGCLGGAGIGLAVGGVATGIGYLTDPGESYNVLPVMIAPFIFGAIGGAVGLGYGMHRDHRTLAVADAALAGVRVAPTLALAPGGTVRWGLAGTF